MIDRPSWRWKERGFRKPGPKPDYARRVIQNRFGLTDKQMREVNVEQIIRCEDIRAIRLLLGISR